MGISTPPFAPRFGSGIPTGSAPPGTIYFDRANSYALYTYDSGLWNPATGVGTYAPSVRNSAVAPNSQTFTLAQAPVNGNTLIAITLSNAAKTANAGWTEKFTAGGIVSNGQTLQVFSKVVAGDTVTSTPISAAVTVGTLAGFEIAHMGTTFDVFSGNATAGSVASDSVTVTPTAASELIIGMASICENNTGIFPTITGATLLAQSANVNRQGVTFSLFPGVVGANLITGNVATNRFMAIMGIAIK